MKLPQSISNGPASAAKVQSELLLAASVLLPLAWTLKARVDIACVLPRQVSGRILTTPTLKRGRAHATRKHRARVPKSSNCPHGTAAYVRPRRLASGRAPGVVVGLPWGHRRRGSHLELDLDLSPRRPAKKDRVCNTG